MISKEFSNKIYWARFICAIMVVGLHCNNVDILKIPVDSWSANIQNFFRNYIYSVAVPFFFIVSGFFFYSTLNKENFEYKWKKHIKKTIYLYLFWNIIYTLYRMIKTNASVLSSFGRSHQMESITFQNIIDGIFLHKYNDVWWFMFQLVILELIAPIIWKIIAKTKNCKIILAVIFVGAIVQSIFITREYPIQLYSFFYYFIGVYIAIEKKQILCEKQSLKYLLFHIVFGEMFIAIFHICGVKQLEWIPLTCLTLGVWQLFYNVFDFGECKEKFKISFFMFAAHPFFVGIVYEIEKRMFSVTNAMSIMCFLINPLIITLLLMITVFILKKIKLYPILTGDILIERKM